jgi:spermidine/putrescine transport system substrate-binding protein
LAIINLKLLFFVLSGSMESSGFQELPADRRVGRRRLLRGLAATGVALAALRLPSGARAAGQAHYLTWNGYDDPALFGPYRERHGADPDFVLFGTETEALDELQGGTLADLFHACNAGIPAWKARGIFQPIDTARLSHWTKLLFPLKTLAGARDDEGQWFVPFEWGQTSITYRTDLVDWPEGEESWDLLWDERYQGRLAVMDAPGDTWWSAALRAGVDFNRVTGGDIERVNESLRAQRPLLRMYAGDMSRVARDLASGDLVAAMTWNETAAALLRDKVPVKFARPKEGALAWACGLMLLRDAPEVDKAHDLIDSLLDPAVGAHLIGQYGHGHANVKSFDALSEERLAELGFSRTPIDILGQCVFQVPQSAAVENRIQRDFTLIKSGG